MLKLGCVNCGAPLEISGDMDVFACGYCGTQQKVQRRGGTVSLRRMEAAIHAIQRGTDRTAAELAMPRLTSELEKLVEARAFVLSSAQAEYERARRGRWKLAFIAFLVVFFGAPALIGQAHAALMVPLTLVWVVASGLVPRYVYRKVKMPPKPGPEMVKSIDAEMAKVQAHIDANRRILDQLPA